MKALTTLGLAGLLVAWAGGSAMADRGYAGNAMTQRAEDSYITTYQYNNAYHYDDSGYVVVDRRAAKRAVRAARADVKRVQWRLAEAIQRLDEARYQRGHRRGVLRKLRKRVRRLERKLARKQARLQEARYQLRQARAYRRNSNAPYYGGTSYDAYPATPAPPDWAPTYDTGSCDGTSGYQQTPTYY